MESNMFYTYYFYNLLKLMAVLHILFDNHSGAYNIKEVTFYNFKQ